MFLVHVAHETAGAARIRHSLRPLITEGVKFLAKLGQIMPRDRDVASGVGQYLYLPMAGCVCIGAVAMGLVLASERVERRLAAVLAADVAGYSRLMGGDEEGTLARLKATRKSVVDPSIASHRGRIVKTTGDGLLVEFASAVDAVRCSIEVQRAMSTQNADVPQDVRIEFRIGIHVGDIIIDDNDIFGDGVNIAARLEGIAEPGGVCISDDAYRQIRSKVEIGWDDLGPQTLKNIAQPMPAWRVQLDDRRASKQPGPGAGKASALALPDKPSIAVLPFQNMSGDPEQEYFADGMVEEIITALSRFKSLFVIARNSSFTFKGKAVDIKQVGRELGVRYVLEGSVRKSGEKVRITSQLIDATSGSHIWADRFDGNLSDVFELQDSVTMRIVGSIAPTLSEAELESNSRKPIENWNSYDYYLRGQKLFIEGNQSGRAGATREALELYRKAITLDPTFGRAYAMLAQCIQGIRDLHGQPISEEERLEALECGEKAIQLAGDDAAALANLGFVFGMLGGDYTRGVELAGRAVALNPNLSRAWNARGVLDLILGNFESALEAFREAMRLNPIDKMATPLSLFGIAAAYFNLGDYERGAEYARRVLILQPNDIRGLFTLVANDCLAGRSSEAEVTAAQIRERFPHLRSSHLRQAYQVKPAANMAKIEQAIAFIGLPD
jgi:adenylate cyclase